MRTGSCTSPARRQARINPRSLACRMNSMSSTGRARQGSRTLGSTAPDRPRHERKAMSTELFVTQATPSFFTTLGAQPLHGRLPNDQDDNRVVVLSYWLWQSWFKSDPAVIGKSYTFAAQTRAVIGIMKPEFRFPDERVAFWIPLQIRVAQVTPDGFGPSVVGRLAPGTNREGLVVQLQPLARRVQQRLGGAAPYVRIMERHRPVVQPLRDHLVGKIATALWILLGTVGIVFLIACANVANLFTVRAESRRRDLVVRRALGAGRRDLVRPQLTEALLLAAAGCVI